MNSQCQINKRIENKKLQILENLTVDLNNKHLQLINGSNVYNQKMLFNDLQNFLDNIEINKCSYSTIFVKLEKKIIDKINLMIKNNEFVSSNGVNGGTKTKLMNTNNSINKNNLSLSLKDVNNLNEENLFNQRSKNMTDLTYHPKVILLEEIKKKQEDEWVKIAKMKYQQFLDEQEKNKTQKFEEKQNIRRNLLNQIMQKDEKKKNKIEEDNKYVNYIKQNVENYFHLEAEKEKAIKKNYEELENFRNKFMIGKIIKKLYNK